MLPFSSRGIRWFDVSRTYGSATLDGTTYALVIAAFAAVAMLASYVPARVRRASIRWRHYARTDGRLRRSERVYSDQLRASSKESGQLCQVPDRSQ